MAVECPLRVETRARPFVGPAMVCPECGAKFRPTHHRQVFCDPGVESKKFHDREKARGAKIAAVAQAWRLRRNVKSKTPASARLRAVGSDAFTDLCRLLDEFSAEDVAAGRPNALEVLARRHASMGMG